MSERLDAAREAFRRHFGHGDFRPAQRAVVASILAGRDTLAVLPTGAGKSACYQIPALVLGDLTVVVSPLMALMQDQVAGARARGLPAGSLHSGLTPTQTAETWRAVRSGELRLLYVSPERLERVASELREGGVRVRLLAVDEAHCIAEWGHDFRPSYRRIRAARRQLGEPQAVAFTGSATPEVRDEIVNALGLGRAARRATAGGCAVHLGSFDRPNLWFGVVRVADRRERLRALLGLLPADDALALVYVPTRRAAEVVARSLVESGYRAAAYHAGLAKHLRAATLEAFLDDRLDVVVATSAFGMGIDKPTVRVVAHWAAPPSLEAYYQEAGRAGRDGAFARCVLLWAEGDAAFHTRQLDLTYPPRRVVEELWRDPRADGAATRVGAAAERLRWELHPDRGPVDWAPVIARRRRAEKRIAAVAAYARGGRCRRAALVGYFGERLAACSGCDRCSAPPARMPDLPPEVAGRIRAVYRALAGRAPWGGCPIEPACLLRLARDPPRDAAALAEVPGVGPALAERYGRTILGALGVARRGGAASPTDEPAPAAGTHACLLQWRAAVAAGMGVAPYVVVTDSVLRTIARTAPATRAELARAGLGPRGLAKFADQLLALLAGCRRG